MRAPAIPNPSTAQTYLESFLLGVGLLTPFNLTLNLIPYLEEVYRWKEVSFYVSLTLTYPSVLVQFVLLPFGQRVTAFSRIKISLCCGAICLGLLGTVGSSSRWLGLLLMTIGGTCTAVLEGSLFGWLSKCPIPIYSQACMAGVAVAGVVATLLQLFLRALFPPNHYATAYIYCGVGVLILIICVVCHGKMSARKDVQAWELGRVDVKSLPSDGDLGPGTDDFTSFCPQQSTSGVATETGNLFAPGVWPEPQDDGVPLTEDKVGWGLNISLLSALALPLCTQLLNFIATFMVFPGLISQVPYKGSLTGLHQPGEWFIVQLLVFGVSDVAARAISSRTATSGPPLSQVQMLLYSVVRLFFIPALAACACGVGGFDDAVFTLLVAGLGGTGGHLASLIMMHAPSLVQVDERDKEMAGLLLVASLHTGIVTGSNLALGFEGLCA